MDPLFVIQALTLQALGRLDEAAPLDDDGQQTNATAVFVGDSETQNMPLLPGNYRGVVIRIDDASKLYVRSAAAGEAVVYRITGVMDQEAAP